MTDWVISFRMQGNRLVVSEEVEHALGSGSKGVIALETAIVTHGELRSNIPEVNTEAEDQRIICRYALPR